MVTVPFALGSISNVVEMLAIRVWNGEVGVMVWVVGRVGERRGRLEGGRRGEVVGGDGDGGMGDGIGAGG